MFAQTAEKLALVLISYQQNQLMRICL